MQRSLTGPVIEAVDAFVEDRDDIVWTIEAVLAYLLAQGSAASQAALRTHAEARDLWLRSQGVGLSARVDAVLDRVVTDERAAERSLGYPLSGTHVAVVIRPTKTAGRTLDLADVDRLLRGLPGVRETLVVPRDERTLHCWLRTVGGDRMAELLRAAEESPAARVALGEPAEGIEGFRLSHSQALAAGAVLAAGDGREGRRVVRFRDVSAVSFLVDRPIGSRALVELVLGGLAGPGEELERLRETLRAYLQEGGNAVAAGHRLFVHRNTVKYRVDRAAELLPRPIEANRLELALALEYCEWVAAWG
jgi:sugar diacid utilization regulator